MTLNLRKCGTTSDVNFCVTELHWGEEFLLDSNYEFADNSISSDDTANFSSSFTEGETSDEDAICSDRNFGSSEVSCNEDGLSSYSLGEDFMESDVINVFGGSLISISDGGNDESVACIASFLRAPPQLECVKESGRTVVTNFTPFFIKFCFTRYRKLF